MAIRNIPLRFIVFPALALWWKISAPILNEFLPVEKEVVLVHPGSEVQFDPKRQYPILDFIGLVERHGYDAEVFNVTTSDGYILRMHRICAGPGNPKAPGKPVVLLQHGFSQTADNFVLVGPNSDFAFLLVDAGYDVWIPNARGNPYSQNHLWKSTKDESYWSFSFHEMALYDSPAFIDFILHETGQEKLTYLGFSMGTTISYILLSMLPEYNDKIDMVYSWAPVAYWKHEYRRTTAFLIRSYDFFHELIRYFNFNQLLPQTASRAVISKRFCSNSAILTQPICTRLFCAIGLDYNKFNKTIGREVLAYFPLAVSYFTYYHYTQNMRKRVFQQYDYGKQLNMIKYGQEEAPYYNLSKITVPVSIWYGNDDYVVNPKDVEMVCDYVPNCSLNKVDDKKWNHGDFLWAKDVRKLVYEKMPLLQKK